MARGPEGVRALVEGRQPLFEFVIRTSLATFDLDTAEGRVAALRAAAPWSRASATRPCGRVRAHARGWIGMDAESVRRAVAAAGKAGSRRRCRRRCAPCRRCTTTKRRHDPRVPCSRSRTRATRWPGSSGRLCSSRCSTRSSCPPTSSTGSRRQPSPPCVAGRARRDPGRRRDGRAAAHPAGQWVEAVSEQAPETVRGIVNQLAVSRCPRTARTSSRGTSRASSRPWWTWASPGASRMPRAASSAWIPLGTRTPTERPSPSSWPSRRNAGAARGHLTDEDRCFRTVGRPSGSTLWTTGRSDVAADRMRLPAGTTAGRIPAHLVRL
ncbi:hypothetical protein NKG05_25325 [Oerskovia sp. M15]